MKKISRISATVLSIALLSTIGGVSVYAQTASYTKTIIRQDPNTAGGVAVDSAGNTYISTNTEIIKLDAGGTILKRWPLPTTLTGARHITVDAQNNVYITSGGVCASAGNGPYVNGVGTVYTPSMSLGVVKFDSNGNQLLTIHAKGSMVDDVAVDSQGNIYVAEIGNQSCDSFNAGFIRKYSSQGTLIAEWELHLLDKDKFVGCNVSTRVCDVVEQEHAANIQLAIDKQDHIWAGVLMATQSNFDWVQEYTASGSLITEWGNFNESQISGIATDAQGNVYLAQRNGADGGTAVYIYSPTGTLQNTIKDGTFNFMRSSDIAVDSSGSVYVANTGNGQPNGTAIMKFSLGGTITSTVTPINGACATAIFSCSAGTSTNNVTGDSATGTSAYTWSCTGTNGGTTASCSQAIPTNTTTNTNTNTNTNNTTTTTTTNSGLSSTQIQAILTLLTSFGANSATIANVQAALGSGSSTTNTTTTTTNSNKLSFSFNFTTNMKLGTVSADVAMLQKVLNALGFTVATTGEGSPGNEGTTFGPATKAALINYQQSVGISATGYLGPLTRAQLNSLSK